MEWRCSCSLETWELISPNCYISVINNDLKRKHIFILHLRTSVSFGLNKSTENSYHGYRTGMGRGGRGLWIENVMASMLVTQDGCTTCQHFVEKRAKNIFKHIFLEDFFVLFLKFFSQSSNWWWVNTVSGYVWISIDSGTGLVPNRHQAIVWTNGDPLHWSIYITGCQWVQPYCFDKVQLCRETYALTKEVVFLFSC